MTSMLYSRRVWVRRVPITGGEGKTFVASERDRDQRRCFHLGDIETNYAQRVHGGFFCLIIARIRFT